MCQAPCRLYHCRQGPGPQKAHDSEARGATRSLIVLAFSRRRTSRLWGGCLQWHFLACEAGLGCFCPAVHRGLSELSKYKRSPSPVCILTLLSALPPPRWLSLCLFLLFLSSTYFSFFTIFSPFLPCVKYRKKVQLDTRSSACRGGMLPLPQPQGPLSCLGLFVRKLQGCLWTGNWGLWVLSSGSATSCWVTLSLSPTQVEPECLS